MGESQPEKHWRQHVARWRASGLTQRQYSQRAGLNVHTLAHWSWRLGRRAGGAARQSLVPIRVIAQVPPVAPMVELRAGSWCLQVPAGTDAEWLASLLRELATC